MRRGLYLLLGMVAVMAIPAPSLAQGGNRSGLDARVVDALKVTLEDERRNEMIYRAVLLKFDVAPFVQIAESEVMHQSALLNLFANYRIPVPENPFTPDQFPVPDTLTECCAMAAEAEQSNADLYTGYLTDRSLKLPWNVQQVFTHLRDASLLHHLPAFEQCEGGTCPDCPYDGTGPGPGPGSGPRKGPDSGPGPNGRR